MNRPQSITSKFKNADIELVNYLLEFEKENVKLHKTIAKLQVKNVSYQHQISALKKFQPNSNILQLVRQRQEQIKKQQEQNENKK